MRITDLSCDIANAYAVLRMERLTIEGSDLRKTEIDRELISALNAKRLVLDKKHIIFWIFEKLVKVDDDLEHHAVFETKTQNLYVLWQGALFNEQ